MRAFDEVEENVARLEDAGVVGEQAEHDPDQEALKMVTAVARGVERIVQPPDQLGGLDVRRILIAEGAALHAENEAERFDMLGQIGKRKRDDLPLVQIVQLEGLEVADQDETRTVALGQRVEVLPGLFVRLGEIASGALLFDEQYTGPEQVDETGAIVELCADVSLVARDAAPLNAEYFEEGVIEALRVALFVGGVAPLAGEGGGAGPDLVPRQPHQAAPAGWR